MRQQHQLAHEKDEFLAILSHELLTPLTAILGWAQLARDQQSALLTQQALEVIERNACRQRRLIEDLLDTSRVLQGRVVLNQQPVDLWRLAAEQVDHLRPQAEERQITLRLQTPEDALPVLADPARLEQVIRNLLVNAVKFTDHGGTVTLTGRRDDGFTLLAVQDTGRGLTPEEMPGIFTRYRQPHLDPSSEGLGIGLALAKGLTELHGGRILASSPGLGKGSTFTIALPVAL
ncbi:MAG: sensor histidine kinase [Armatimonadota bacterium]